MTDRILLPLGCVAAFSAASLCAQEPLNPPPGNAVPPPAEQLTRGPIHEAFAEQYNLDPVEGLIVPKEPPDPIDEIPPETRPEGENVEWIPGYWGWDDQRNDFIWVSGVWRNFPPGQRWVPGYWSPVETGFQWTPGFWTAAGNQQLNYLPAPPESLEAGPNVQPADDGYFWVPGSWLYVGGEYRWRPGYYSAAYDNWVWVPARYVWTPCGYLYVNGYWDYRLPYRGVLYAPIYVDTVRYPHYTYRPSVVLNVGRLLLHWFVRPRYCHYYYGDYYGDYAGIYPWYSFYGRRRCYDPLLTFYRWHSHRHYHYDYVDRLRAWHGYYLANERYRPPRRYAALNDFERRVGAVPSARRSVLASNFDDFARDRRERGGFDFVRNTGDNRNADRDRFRSLASQRARSERGPRSGSNADNLARSTPRSLQLPDVPGRSRSLRTPSARSASSPRTFGNATRSRRTLPGSSTAGNSASSPRFGSGSNVTPRSGGTTRSLLPRSSASPRSGRSNVSPGASSPRFAPRSSTPRSGPRGLGSSRAVSPRSSTPSFAPRSSGSVRSVSPRSSGSARSPSSSSRTRRPSFTPRSTTPGFAPRSSGSTRSVRPRSSTPSFAPRSSGPARSVSPRSSGSGRPSFTPRSSSPSFRPRSSGPSRSVRPRSTAPSFTPRSSGSVRSVSPRSSGRARSPSRSAPRRSQPSPSMRSRSSGSSRAVAPRRSSSSRSGRSVGSVRSSSPGRGSSRSRRDRD